eukprot:g3763.t1
MSLPADKEQELSEAFNLYCIYNEATDRFEKDNEGKIVKSLLGHVLRAIGCCPTSIQIDELTEELSGEYFTIDEARAAAIKLFAEEQDTAEDICMAYDVLAEPGHKENCIHKDLLAQKMKRRLVTDYLTDQMIADAQPDSSGQIDYTAFVNRQFAVKNLEIKMKPLPKTPTVDEMKARLVTLYGNPQGPEYPYPFLTNEELYKKLGGSGDETRKFLAFGKEQLGVLKSSIASEESSNMVANKLKQLAETTSVSETQVLLRELEASLTGYKYVMDLRAISLKVTGMLDDLSSKDQALVEKLEAQKQRIIQRWTEYTG